MGFNENDVIRQLTEVLPPNDDETLRNWADRLESALKERDKESASRVHALEEHVTKLEAERNRLIRERDYQRNWWSTRVEQRERESQQIYDEKSLEIKRLKDKIATIEQAIR